MHAAIKCYVHKANIYKQNNEYEFYILSYSTGPFRIWIVCRDFWMPNCDVRDDTYWHQAGPFFAFREKAYRDDVWVGTSVTI